MRTIPWGGGFLILLFAATTSIGCSDTVYGGPSSTATVVLTLPSAGVQAIDLLLVIDDTPSMADKQTVLAVAVPDLVQTLLNPPCVDAEGNPVGDQPSSPTAFCPAGSKRLFQAVADVHVGIVSSSLGAHGADGCPSSPDKVNPNGNPTMDDRGHLVARSAPGSPVPQTYHDQGFLAWDPENLVGGTTVLGDPSGAVNAGLTPTLVDMVLGVGNAGCGYPSQLESWYRFLVEPHPFDSIAFNPTSATFDPSAEDDTALLQQRAEFLRPSSLLAIVMLSGENDCSIKEYGQSPFAAAIRNPLTGATWHFPRPRQICASHPSDPCCAPCNPADPTSAPSGCQPDPTCAVNGGYTTDLEDDPNLRCFDQKRRFGIDLLYPTSRYIDGLSKPQIVDRFGNTVDNPIFSLNAYYPDDHRKRDGSFVVLTGIVGVPWQDIALDPNDLKAGFKDSVALGISIPGTQQTTWDVILGDPDTGVRPLDPHMVESTAPRVGIDPIPGVELAPPGSAPNTDRINGHEYSIPAANSLEYACAFDLPVPRDCSSAASPLGCDCSDPTNDKPICSPNPNDGGNRTLQTGAKAYPGLRELEVLKGLGPQGAVGSICPAQFSNATGTDFAYRPAIESLVERLKTAIGGECVPFPLHPDGAGQVACLAIEARATGGHCDATCADYPARVPVSSKDQSAITQIRMDSAARAAGLDCFCEIPQTAGEGDLNACIGDAIDPPTNSLTQAPVNGWCYIDLSVESNANPALVAVCPAAEQRLIRFVGEGTPRPSSTTYVLCSSQ